MKRPAKLGALFAALVSIALVFIAGCGEDNGGLVPNYPPGVRLTATPPDSGTSGYDVEFYWEGWDSDGEVDHFIYAIDPPDMHGAEDSLWTRTDANSGSFVFEATDYDTLYHWKNPQIAKSWHVFVIRAVDDRGGISEPDYLAFNAATVAPRTQFKTPPPAAGIEDYMGNPQAVGLKVTLRWDGDDADALFNEGPVGYFFKAIDVTGKRKHELATAMWADTTEWVEHGPDNRKVVLDLDDGRNYAIAARAVDEAGAVEPLLLLNGNMLWVGARKSSSFPELTVRSTAFGQRMWQGWGVDIEKYEVPLGSRYGFTISGNAGWYGGLITGFSFGWDLQDLESNVTDPDGKGAWTPWSTSRTAIPAEFTEGGDHFLHVRCKDDGGGVTLATMKFNVIQLSPTKNLCYIDDWRKYKSYTLRGEEIDDEVWQAMLEGYNYGEDWGEVSWDERDENYHEHMPTLEFLSQFRVVVWSLMETRSEAPSLRTAWFHMNSLNTMNVLAVYMTGNSSSGERGKVWAFGYGLVQGALIPDVGSECGYPYAVDEDMSLDSPCGIGSHSFVVGFMHITGEFDDSDMSSGGARISAGGYRERFVRVFVDTAGPAIPRNLYTRPPAADLYPNLPPVLARHPDGIQRSYITNFEVLQYPGPDQEHEDLFYDPVSERMTGLIPLYRVHSNNSNSHNKYCGFRYIPMKPTDPGEIVYFLFPMFPFDDSQIRATAKVVLSDWFGLPDPDVPGAGSDGEGISGVGARR